MGLWELLPTYKRLLSFGLLGAYNRMLHVYYGDDEDICHDEAMNLNKEANVRVQATHVCFDS